MGSLSGSVLKIFGDHLHYKIKEKTNTADLSFGTFFDRIFLRFKKLKLDEVL